MHSSQDRCSLHPQRRVVGICAHCLRDRLTCLLESITSSEDVTNAAEEDAVQKGHIERMSFEPGIEQKVTPAQLPRVHPLTQDRSSKNDAQSCMKASAEIGIRSHANLEDSLNSALQKVKHAHQQLSFVAQSPYQGAIKVAPAASSLVSNAVAASHNKHTSLPASCRRSNASESDLKTFPGGTTMSAKKKAPWFSISKGKNSLLSSPLPEGSSTHDEKHLAYKSPQVMIYAGRKSASDAIAGSCNGYRQAYLADLEAIAEINIGEAAIKVDQNEGSADARANPSWLSSLFHRRKGSRSKADTQQHVGGRNTHAPSARTSASIQQSPKISIDAGRLSLDGARPTSFKQILRKIEARSKHQSEDFSPSQNAEHATKQCNDRNEDMLAVQESKALTLARSSISEDMPGKHVSQASSSPMMSCSNAITDMECDDGDADRARSWGRAWNRMMSPLLGFKNHDRQSVHDSLYQYPGYGTPDHTIFKKSIGLPPTASSYLSPLRRSKHAPDAHIYAAGTVKNAV